ncbi:hypothetical protein NL676_029422 [Syzygium grande]|nr:hypothetical protein NL676_029422 [Syzygium grande]
MGKQKPTEQSSRRRRRRVHPLPTHSPTSQRSPRNPISDSDNNAIRMSSLPLTGITGHPREKKIKQNKNRHLRLRVPVGAIRDLRQSHFLSRISLLRVKDREHFPCPENIFPGKRRNREIPRSQARRE